MDQYSKDMDSQNVKHDGDPGLALFEFIIVLARIGLETSKDFENLKKFYEIVIEKFFKSYLSLRNNKDLEISNEFKGSPTRPYLIKLRDYYRISSDDYDNKDIDSEEEE